MVFSWKFCFSCSAAFLKPALRLLKVSLPPNREAAALVQACLTWQWGSFSLILTKLEFT